MEVLQEMYFGKVIGVQQIESLLEKIRLKYYDADAQTYFKEINRDPLIKQLGEMIRDQFGFGEVTFTISPHKSSKIATLRFIADKSGNAYTDTGKVRMRDQLVVTSEGIKWNDKEFHPNILIICTLGLLTNRKITTPELTAAILHEIGHSFGLAMAERYSGRIDEKVADQFPAMYGYGPELVSILGKVYDLKTYDSAWMQSMRKIPIVNLFTCVINIGKNFFDRVINQNEHPSLERRMQDTVKQMESDLRNTPNLSPKMKKELQMLIVRTKEEMEKHWNNTPYLSDKVYKTYARHIEPLYGVERAQNDFANTYAGSEVTNKVLNDKYGHFKTYNLKKVK